MLQRALLLILLGAVGTLIVIALYLPVAWILLLLTSMFNSVTITFTLCAKVALSMYIIAMLLNFRQNVHQIGVLIHFVKTGVMKEDIFAAELKRLNIH